MEFGDSGGGGELGTLVGRREVDRTEVVASEGDLGVVMIEKTSRRDKNRGERREEEKGCELENSGAWSFCLSIATSEVFGDDVLDSAPRIGR